MTLEKYFALGIAMMALVGAIVCAVIYSRAFVRLCNKQDSLARENQDLHQANLRQDDRNSQLRQRADALDHLVKTYVPEAHRNFHLMDVGRPLCTETDPNAPLGEEGTNAAA